ncbi:MAG: TonB family protein [Thiohalomonadaceae bacterium]
MAAWLVQPEQQSPALAMEVISVALVEKRAASAPRPKQERVPAAAEPVPVAESTLPVPRPPEPVAKVKPPLQAEPQVEPQPQELAEAEAERTEQEAREATEALTAPVFEAAYLRNKPPAYPRSARKLRQQGTVELRVRVSAEGAPVELTVLQSSGVAVLDKAALSAVRQWRFVPARRGGTATEAWVVVPIHFRLEG